MKKTASRLLRLIVILGLATWFTGNVSTAAHADTGYGYCWQSGCTGLDPVAENCTVNATTVWSHNYGNYQVDLRYSPDCEANWARVTTATAEPFFVKNSNGNVAKYTSAAGVTSWTNMVNGAPSVHDWACLEIPTTDQLGETAIWASDYHTGGEAIYPNCPSNA